MGHDHHHDHDDHSHLSEIELRVRALESILVEKGYVDPAAIDALVETYEVRVGPRNGAKVVAKAWADPTYRERLRTDATAAIASLGFIGRQGEHMVAVENTPDQHNMVVCTLCSCYPWPVLGFRRSGTSLPPTAPGLCSTPWGSRRVWGAPAGDHPHPCLGLDSRGQVSRDPDASQGNRGHERGGLGRTRHPRLHDRHGARAEPEAVR